MKIEEQVLSREQMAHLKELGVDTSDSSMMWYRCDDGNAERWYIQINNELSQSLARIMKGTVGCLVPTYTIGDLIEKIPKQIGWYELSVCWKNDCIKYDNWIPEEVTDYIGDFNFEYRPLIEALYDCLCWVAENHKELIK